MSRRAIRKFSIDDIINSPCGTLNSHIKGEAKKNNKITKPRNDCPEVQWIHWQLKYWCREKKIQFEKEYKFSSRKFRFDFALPGYKIGIEYDGLNSEKSGHTTLKGFTKDTEKINIAISLGWKVLRYTVLNYKNVLSDVSVLCKKTLPL